MFGIIEGAIIGAVVGVIVSLVMILKRKGLRKELLRLLKAQGADAARAYLDRKHPPLRKIPIGKLLDQRERMAALALLGHTSAIEEELAGHRGALTCTVQVGAIGLLGLTLRSPDPADAARRLDELATKMEQEGGRTMALVKKKIRALATLARAMAEGEQIPSETRLTLESFSGDGGMVQLLAWQATAIALEKTGGEQQAAALRAKVRQITDVFEQPAAPQAPPPAA
jgi:tetrahydromethanopterin S-methyltransferase subunit G